MIPLFSVKQIRESDSYAISELGIPGLILMENASVSIFNIVQKTFSLSASDSSIGFVCGKGNNGGDGFAVARHFVNNGFRVVVISLSEETELQGDALLNFQILKSLLDKVEGSVLIEYRAKEDIELLEECQIIFDAMLGTGAKGKLKQPYLSIVQQLNLLNARRIAIDIPTGLDADSGSGGEVIFNADLTVTLAELKRGLFISKGASFCGNVQKGYIGLPGSYFDDLEIDDYIIEPEDAFLGIPYKAADIYKYSAGKVLVVAGSASFPGAPVMTSTSVLKSGAGACFLCYPSSAKMLVQPKLNEVIIEPYSDDGNGFLRAENIDELKKKFDWMDLLAIGPGLGRDSKTMQAVIEIIKCNSGKKIVIDADAIFALGDGKYKELDLSNSVITPHHAEFANLLGIKLSELQRDILSYGKSFAQMTGAFLVLKGAPSVIFNPSGEAFINSTGNPGMAKFGTGDVLTGIIAGLLAQSDEIEDTLITAVYLHSLSADLLLKDKTEFGIMATDIANNLPEAIKFLRKSCV
ncbi:MAG: NAD(P)H-hydrate dehydratase [Clostridiales bacterium]